MIKKIFVLLITAVIIGGIYYFFFTEKKDQEEVKSEVEKVIKQVEEKPNIIAPTAISDEEEKKKEIGDEESSSADKVIPKESEGEGTKEGEIESKKEVVFSSCGNVSSFSKEEWYKNFSASIAKLAIAEKDITASCFSEEGEMVVMIIPSGEKCTASVLYQYDISKGVLEKAELEDYGEECLAHFTDFGKRDGSVIKVTGLSEADGCKSDLYFDYDYIKNSIELTKKFTTCTTKNPEKEGWKEY